VASFLPGDRHQKKRKLTIRNFNHFKVMVRMFVASKFIEQSSLIATVVLITLQCDLLRE
jgi:hypothetical protein